MSLSNIELVQQSHLAIRMKLELYDHLDVYIGEVQGLLTSLSMTVDGSSDIRRTSNLTLHDIVISNEEAMLDTLWFRNVIKLYYGVLDNTINDFVWFQIGSFILSKNSYSIDIQATTITLSLIDMMGATTAERGRCLSNDLLIPAESVMRDVIEATVEEYSSYTRHNVCNFDQLLPYDIEASRGDYPIQPLSALIKLYPYYEQFYSIDGAYVVQLLPLSYSDPSKLSVEDMSSIVIRENGDNVYADIKNAVEIWGQELDALYSASICVTEGGTYELYVADTFETLEDGMTVSFVPDTNSVVGQSLKIQNTAAYGLYTQRGDGSFVPLTNGAIKANVSYVVEYTEERFILQGQSIIHAMCMEFNIEPTNEEKAALCTLYDCDDIAFLINSISRFACDRADIGVQMTTLSGDEYDAIYTTELALERARYETWKLSRAKNGKKLTCLYTPWLDVNQKISYQSIRDGSVHQYLVDQISVSQFDGTMEITISQFHPLYSWMTGDVWGSALSAAWADDLLFTWGDVNDATSWGADAGFTWDSALNQTWGIVNEGSE